MNNTYHRPHILDLHIPTNVITDTVNADFVTDRSSEIAGQICCGVLLRLLPVFSDYTQEKEV